MTDSLEGEIRTLRSLFWSDRDPDGRGFVPLADAYLRAGDAKQAWEVLNDGLDRHPDFSPGHVMAARLYAGQGLYAEAEISARSALGLDPENVDAMRTLVSLLEDRGEAEESMRYRRHLAVLEPESENLEPKVAEAEDATPAPVEVDLAVGAPPEDDVSTDEAPAPVHEEVVEFVATTPDTDSAGSAADPAAGAEKKTVGFVDLAYGELEGGVAEDDVVSFDAPEPEVEVQAVTSEVGDMGAVAPDEPEPEPAVDLVFQALDEPEPEPAVDLISLAPDEPEPEPIVELMSLAPDEPEPEPAVDLMSLAPDEPEPEPIVELVSLAPDEPEPEPAVDLMSLAPDEPEPEPIVELVSLAPDDPEPEPEPAVDLMSLAPDEPEPEPAVDLTSLAPDEGESADDEEAATPEEEALADAPAEHTLADPINTRTMAELYVSQGLWSRAVEVYQKLLAASPDDHGLRHRLDEVLVLQAQATTDAPGAVHETGSTPAQEAEVHDEDDEVETLARDLAESGRDGHEVDSPFAWPQHERDDEPEADEGPTVGDFFGRMFKPDAERDA